MTAIGVQPDGKIVIGGVFDNYNGTSRRGLARLNDDGTLDATFSTAFVVISTEEIVPQSDGKILIAGLANPTGFSRRGQRRDGNRRTAGRQNRDRRSF